MYRKMLNPLLRIGMAMLACRCVFGFAGVGINISRRRIRIGSEHISLSAHGPDFEDYSGSPLSLLSRRRILSSLLFGSLTFQATTSCALAASGDKTIWLTGKEPVVSGQKTRDKNDVSGTKKDPKFLRSLADCKSQCENGAGSDGYARSKEECLSDCQDICCTTYQQCTFAIVNRI